MSWVGALCAAGLLWASSAGAQNGDGAAPRTAWGDPDLQGIWNNSTTTPLEQLTEAEQQRDRDARAPVIAATRGTGAAWPETGGRLEQPSLIIDPPNGRISMTPEAISRLVAREKAREGRGEADSWLDRNSWERFTRVDAETIDYRFTVDDPGTYTRPYTVAIPFRWRENQAPIYEYACHEGNYGMVNLLTGGRADEQLARDASALVSGQRLEGGHPGVREPAVPFVTERDR